MSLLNLNKKRYFSKDNIFLAGIFLLPSAPVIAIFFFLISFISSKIVIKDYFKDIWNKSFLISSFLIILNCIIQTKTYIINNFINYNIFLTWLGLVNLLPFFIFFWLIQPFLKNPEQRIRVIQALTFGTFPIIFSGFTQYFLNWTGPFKFLNGLIVWYQGPLSITDGLTGPFNNSNYAGLWLSSVWPFSLALFQILKNNKFKKILIFFVLVLFITSIVLTNSRSSWIGILITSPIVMGFKSIYWLAPVCIIIAMPVLLILNPIFSNSFKEVLINLLPFNFLSNFPLNENNLIDFFPRIEIWNSALKFFSLKPLQGNGGGSFPYLYSFYNDKWIGHAHNLPLELGISYGLVPMIIILVSILFLVIKGTIKIISKNRQNLYTSLDLKIIDFSWIASLIFITISQLFDVQYFDFRISILLWILLAGCKMILIE